MKQIFTCALVSFSLIAAPFTLAVPLMAHAQTAPTAASHYSVPLAIIRFNQPRVYFQNPLSNALRSALQIDPNVSFTVVSYVPSGSTASLNAAERNLQQVLQQLYSSGINPSNVKVEKKAASGLAHSEVHLFVSE